MSGHIIFAYSFDGKGGGEELSESDIPKKIKDNKLAWVHLDVNHSETRAWLEKEVSYLDPFIIEALLAEETRPRMTQIDKGVLLILRGVNLNKNSDPEDMVSIRLWVDEYRIITLRIRRLKALDDIETMIKQGRGPQDAGDFIGMLVSKLFHKMEPVLSELDEITDDIEEHILKNADTSLREPISGVRKKAIMLRRHMAPQRDAINRLQSVDIRWLKVKHKRNFQESYNEIMRYVEDLDAIRERSQIVKDELANIISERLSRNMYILSVIAAIFLPLGFFTGLLGINVGGIPGAENTNAFLIFCSILAGIMTLQIAIFKRFKWF